MKAIQRLLQNNIPVGLRFIPLLEVKNYETIYRDFLLYVKEKIDFTKISSVFIGWLLYTKNDYNTMMKKRTKSWFTL